MADNVEGFDKVAAEQFKGNTGTSSWPLTAEQMKRIEGFLVSENESIKRLGEAQLTMREMQKQIDALAVTAEKTRGEREKFCRQLEQDLVIPKGTSWIVNFSKQCVEKRAT